MKVLLTLLLVLGGYGLSGCGNTKGPSSPDNTPIFTMDTQPTSITPPENAQIYLHAQYPYEGFNNMMGAQIFLSCSSPEGFFTPDQIYHVDTTSTSGVTPPVWYNFGGLERNFSDTIYAHIVNSNFQTLAWNYCLVQIVGNQ